MCCRASVALQMAARERSYRDPARLCARRQHRCYTEIAKITAEPQNSAVLSFSSNSSAATPLSCRLRACPVPRNPFPGTPAAGSARSDSRVPMSLPGQTTTVVIICADAHDE